QLYGDVLVQRYLVDPEGQPAVAPQMTVRGEYLQALADTEQLRSHLPVTINYGGAELQAQTFVYDHLHSLLNYSRRTTGRFDMGPGGKAARRAAGAKDKKASP